MSKVRTFAEAYVGPHGAHLGELTYFTRNGKPAADGSGLSIHPRVIAGRTVFPKSHTAKAEKTHGTSGFGYHQTRKAVR